MATNRYRQLTELVSWREEKNGPVARESAALLASQPVVSELLGQPYCSGCESWECTCECGECGRLTQTIVDGLCIPCRDIALDAAEHDAPDSVNALGMSGQLEAM